MGFIHPGIAWATVGLATIPLIVHLLNRRRYREEPWAAMEFLLRAHRRSRRRIRLEEWILLAVRTGIILLIGLAIARPHTETSPLASALGETRADRVIILDDSLSMQAVRADGRTAFEAAQAAALELIDGFGASDRVGLVTASDKPRALAALGHNHDAIRHAIMSTRCTARPARIDAAIEAAARMVDRDDSAATLTAYVVTDVSSGSLSRNISAADPDGRTGSSSRDRRGVAAAARMPAAIGELCFVNTGPERRPNLAIEDLRCKSQLVATGVPTICEVRIANHGDAPSAARGVEIRLDGALLRSMEIPSLAPEGVHTEEFLVEFSDVGVQRLSAHLRTDSSDILRIDDERYLAVRTPANLAILFVEDGPYADPQESQSYYCRAALASRQNALSAGAADRVVASHELASQVLSRYSLVVLANVKRLPPGVWNRVGGFVRDGGGLLMLLGDRVDATSYNRLFDADADARASDGGAKNGNARAGFDAGRVASGDVGHATNYADGTANGDVRRATNYAGIATIGDTAAPQSSGLLPVRLGAMVETAPSPDSVGFELADATHPALLDLTRHGVGGLQTASAWGFWRCDPDSQAGRARTLLRLTSGEPAVVAHDLGRGRVVTMLTGADMGWSNLPAKPDYVPLILNLASHATGGRTDTHTLLVSRPFTARLSAQDVGRSCDVLRPDGHEIPVEIEPHGDAAAVVYGDTETPGFYALAIGDETSHFAVNINANDSRLTALDEKAIRGLFGERAQLAAPEGLRSAGETRSIRTEFASTFLVGLFVLTLVEGALGTLFGHRR